MMLVPPSSHDLSNAFALLRIISDPKAAKDALEALAASADELRRARDEANAALASSREQAEKAAALVQEVEPREQELSRWEAQLKKREREVAEREEKILAVKKSWAEVT
jgi:chromosome segregation ATPase